MTAPYNDHEARIAIVLIVDDYRTLRETPIILAEDYLKAVAAFENSVLRFARAHRNWNEEIKAFNLPEESYFGDAECGIEFPDGWFPPVDARELATLEVLSAELYWSMVKADLRTPALCFVYSLAELDKSITNVTDVFDPIIF